MLWDSDYYVGVPALRIVVEILFRETSLKRLKQKPAQAFLLGSAQKKLLYKWNAKGIFWCLSVACFNGIYNRKYERYYCDGNDTDNAQS